MADASNAEDPAQDAPSPTQRAGARRTVTKTFRVSAVWRPWPLDVQDTAHRPAGERVSDEELVYGLVAQRKHFDQRALTYARALQQGVVSVTLEDVRPAASVAAQIAFEVRVRGS